MKKNWPTVQLGEVLRPIERPEAPKPGTVYRQIGVKLWGIGAYERERLDGGATRYANLFRAEAGDVIVNKIWARNGSVAVVSEALAGCYGSGEFPMFSPNRQKLDPRWIHWLVKTPEFWTQCDEKSQGTSGQNRIRPERFLEIRLPLPPLAEQRRVVARIEELAPRIQEARTFRAKAVDETETFGKVCLRAAILGCQAEDVELESVCEAIIDNLHSNPIYALSGIPCIRSSDVGQGTLDLATALRTNEAEYLRRTARGEPQADDIVFVREGGGTGKCALVLPRQRFSLGQRVMILRPNRERIVPRFFLYQLLSPLVQDDQIVPLCKGSASPHLNIGSMRRFHLRLPPLPEQHRMVAKLDGLQAELGQVKRLQAEAAAEVEALLPALLDSAFKGDL